VKSCLKNILITVGSYWLSTWAVVPLGMLFGKITNHIIYSDGVLAAILMGVVLSLGRAVAAGLAGTCVTLFAEGKSPEYWALVPTALYATRLFRYHFAVSPSAWDRLEVNVQKYFPALVCFAAALLVARLRRVRTSQSPAK
jgi:hypothetical protein